MTRRSPLLAERHGASAGTSRLPDRLSSASSLHRGQHRIASARRAELQRLDQVGRELVQGPPAVGGSEQRIFIGQFGQVLDLAAHAQQLGPADRLVDGFESVALIVLCRGERIDRAVEQRISRPTSPALAA